MSFGCNIYVYDIYQRPDARPRVEEGLGGADHPLHRREPRPAWLRDQPADRDALGGTAEIPHRLALSPALSPRGARLAARAMGGEGRAAAAAVLPAHRRGPARARQPAHDLENLRRRDAAHHRSRPCVNWILRGVT